MPETIAVLPNFQDPPIVESVIGVEFAELDDWSIMSFSDFWRVIQEEYPRYEIQPPIGSMPIQEMVLEYGFPGKLPVRCLFHHFSDAQLLQVQNNRFLYNWRKYLTEGIYPRYDKTIRPEFVKEWKRFCDFLKGKDIDLPQVKSCEVTYVNHLERSKEWESFEDLSEVFNFWQKSSSSHLLSEPSSLSLQIVYPMTETSGTLIVNVQPAIRNNDSKEIIQFRLTAVGKPASSNVEDILSCLDIERYWVVRSFLELTTEKMHRIWGIK